MIDSSPNFNVIKKDCYILMSILLFTLHINIHTTFCLQQNLQKSIDKNFLIQLNKIESYAKVKKHEDPEQNPGSNPGSLTFKITSTKQRQMPNQNDLNLEQKDMKKQKQLRRYIKLAKSVDLSKQKNNKNTIEELQKNNMLLQKQNNNQIDLLKQRIKENIQKQFINQKSQNSNIIKKQTKKTQFHAQNTQMSIRLKPNLQIKNLQDKLQENYNKIMSDPGIKQKQLNLIRQKREVKGFPEPQNHKNKIAAAVRTSNNFAVVNQPIQPVKYLNNIINPVYKVAPYPIYVLYPTLYVNSHNYPPFQTISNPINIHQKQIPQRSSIIKIQDETKIKQSTTKKSKPPSNSAAVTDLFLDRISNLATNKLQSPSSNASKSPSNTSLSINISPLTTPQILNLQITTKNIDNIFSYLIQKTDQKFYNTNQGEKVFQVRKINLNVTNNIKNDSNSVIGPNSILTLNISRNSTNLFPNGTANSTNQTQLPLGGVIIPLSTIQILNKSTNVNQNTNNTILNPTNILNNIKNISTNNSAKIPVINDQITGTYLDSSQQIGSEIQLKYQEYLIKYKPKLLTQNPSEITVYRQTIFNLNIKNLYQHNSKFNKTYTAGVNLFTDLTEDQFNRQFAKLVVNDDVKKQAVAVVNALQNQGKTILTQPDPISIDWSCLAGPVISQGVCGACYTIAALESIEMTMRIYNQSVNYLSIQQVISCGNNGKDLNGCVGGFFSGAYNYCKNFGVGQSFLYFYDDLAKYQGILSQCNNTLIRNKNYEKSKVFIRDSQLIRYGDCKQIVNTLQKRVLTVAIAAFGLQFYSDGTFQTQNKNINHGVVLVGYDPSQGYLIKNSWGSIWGNKGYGYLSTSTGLCSYAMYPILLNQDSAITQCN